MILIDSSVLLDIVTEDPVWFEWSSKSLVAAAEGSVLCINPVIYAEVSIRFSSPEEFDRSFPEDPYRRLPIPYPAAFLAGRAHLAYRRKGGPRTTTLPDFFIGAHAAFSRLQLLTRDPRRFRKYFPAVELIAPE